MEHTLAGVAEERERQGYGNGPLYIDLQMVVGDTVHPTHEIEVWDRLTHVTCFDDIFLIATEERERLQSCSTRRGGTCVGTTSPQNKHTTAKYSVWSASNRVALREGSKTIHSEEQFMLGFHAQRALWAKSSQRVPYRYAGLWMLELASDV